MTWRRQSHDSSKPVHEREICFANPPDWRSNKTEDKRGVLMLLFKSINDPAADEIWDLGSEPRAQLI